MRTSVGHARVVGSNSGLQYTRDESRVQRLWPAGEGMAGGRFLVPQYEAPGHSLSGDKWRCEPSTRQIQSPKPLTLSHSARAKQSAAGFAAVEAALSSAADCGKRAGDCLSEASSSQPPQTASSARNRAAALPSARLSFAYFWCLHNWTVLSSRRYSAGFFDQPQG
jgi:hypothetical protein